MNSFPGFFLASTARAGTTYLGRLLGSHPDIGMDSEILYPDPEADEWLFYRFWAERVRQDMGWISPNRLSALINDYLEGLRTRPEAGRPAYGFDIKLEQLALLPHFRNALLHRGPRVVLLKRANLLKQVVSEFLMYRRLELGATEVHSGAVPPRLTLEIHPDCVVNTMRHKRRLTLDFAKDVADLGLRCLHVIYEDLLSPRSEEQLLAEVQHFLGVDAMPLSSGLAKQNPDHVEALIENYAEVRNAVENSEFEYTLYLPT